MQHYPKVKSVEPLDGLSLLVTFQDETRKIYDCSPLVDNDVFEALTNRALFKMVKADQGGYGISWNDSIDLSESELWINGKSAEQKDRGDV